MGENSMKIPLEKIEFREEYRPRKLNWLTVLSYSEAMKAGKVDDFPAISVVKEGSVYIGLDGAHRVEGAKGAKLDSFEAKILKIPKREWLAFAVQVNCINGYRLSPYELVDCYHRLKQTGYSDNKIGDIMRIRPTSLRRMVINKSVRLDRTAVTKHTLVNIVDKGTGQVLTKEELDEIQKPLCGQSQVALVQQLDRLFRYEVIDLTDADVIEALFALKKSLDLAVKKIKKEAA